MDIKLLNAVNNFKNLQHQIETWEWLQSQLTPKQLDEFAVRYRKNDKEQPIKPEVLSNTWDGVLGIARTAGAKFPEVVAAQWALESNHGQNTSGKNNYFGLKGAGTNVNTQEFINNQWITITDGFIDFPNIETCISYLVNRWYKDFGSYKGVNRASTWEECTKLLVTEGYATDPGYATKLITLIKTKTTQPTEEKKIKLNPLPVPYMSQRDNYRDASRTCFSSSCAMLLKFLKPNSIKGDDDYLRTVFSYGDSTSSSAQLSALKHYGLSASFITNGSRNLIKKQIDAGKPVPAGFLHHGNVSAPQGGGHYLCIIGYNDSGYWVNDPWGDCDLINGTYPSTNGSKLNYSYKNFEPRWLVEGPNSGWCIIAD